MNVKHTPVKCDKCGQLFTPKRSNQHYCRKKLIKKCVICGSEFETNCSDDERITCNNPECRKKAAHSVSYAASIKICKRCGNQFETTNHGQAYCNQLKTKVCPICNKTFEYVCGQADVPATCGDPHCQGLFIKQKRVANVANEVRVCKWCGKEFHPREVRDVYCYDTHYKECVICGKRFVFDPRKHRSEESNTCSKECKGKLMSQNHDYVKGVETHRKNYLALYGYENPLQNPEVREKGKQTSLERYGKEWYTQTDEYKNSVKETSLEKYGVEHHLKSKDVIAKRIQTTIDKYGVDNVFKSEEIKDKIRESNKEKYGVEYLIHSPEIRSKMARNSKKTSRLEQRICNLLDNYGITYIHHYTLNRDDLAHEFDFYLPEYKLLIDADGLYFHSYLDDPNGKQVRDDYDEVRLSLIPPDHRFYLIIEGNEDTQIKALVDKLESIKCSLSTLDSIVFEWCRSIDFPYPKYSKERMLSDYSHLVQYYNDRYIPQCRLGQSILKNFHRSIYDAKVGNSVSPKEGWNDDDKLKQVIRNRFIYVNNVDPSKILSGFNISKICPCVSTFNPVLAKYLINKYLSEFDSIFDPFSGFSGRLIGTASTGKAYLGQDLNAKAVSESNEIIQFLGLNDERYQVTNEDILNSIGTYECLLTCPPYYKKEIYNDEKVFKSCDDWITECLNRFKCARYVFVVDETYIFNDSVVEEIKSQSHLNKVSEYVVVIDN